MKIIILVLIILAFTSLCTQKSTQDIEQQAVFTCIQICKNNSESISYEDGPCLSDKNSEWSISDWVCDIAHSPRISGIDDKPENQCQEFREGKAHHFVEVDLGCNLITVV